MRAINKHRRKSQQVFAKSNARKEEARLARLDARVAKEAEMKQEIELKPKEEQGVAVKVA
jgi:hypothetical protein